MQVFLGRWEEIMNKLVEVRNLTIKLGERVLFENLNFSIEKGDGYMLLGDNGTGKSLLLELIALGNSNDLRERYKGLTVQGEILNSNGENLLDPKVENRDIVYVTQDENFYNNATILSEVRSACCGMGVELDEVELDNLLEYFEIKTNKNKKLKNNLSYGEGKIIHLISNILKLGKANILLMDEPLNHLSFKNSKRLNDLILKMREQNPDLAILVVSHCCAINFVDNALRYNYEEKQMTKMGYSSYDCFDRI